jgi:malonyl-CoA decarboxylase
LPKEIVDTNDWMHDKVKSTAIKPVLMRLCAEYLVSERRGNVALDPVGMLIGIRDYDIE